MTLSKTPTPGSSSKPTESRKLNQGTCSTPSTSPRGRLGGFWAPVPWEEDPGPLLGAGRPVQTHTCPRTCALHTHTHVGTHKVTHTHTHSRFFVPWLEQLWGEGWIRSRTYRTYKDLSPKTVSRSSCVSLLPTSLLRGGKPQQGGAAGWCCPGRRPSSQVGCSRRHGLLPAFPQTAALILDSLQESVTDLPCQCSQEFCGHLR